MLGDSFVINDDVTSLKKAPNLEAWIKKYETAKQHNLPFLVLVDDELQKVIGFRLFMVCSRVLLPCEMPNTLDASMYIRPEYTNLGL
jgi:L-amino acid N-acyltransferase YncA